MTSAFWMLILVVVANATVFHFLPRFSRPDILFGVTVPEAFVAGPGRAIVFRYRVRVWTGAAAALAVFLWLRSPQGGSTWRAMLLPIIMTGNIVVAHVAWQLARQKTRAYAAPPPEVRVASLVTRDTSLPGGALFAAGPFAILLATGLLLYTYRNDLPNDPDAGNPYGQVALAAIFVTMGLMMAVTMVRRSRQVAVDGPAAAAEQRFRRINALGLVLAAYGAAILMSVVAVESIPAFSGILDGRGWLMVMPLMLIVGMMLVPMVAGRLLF
jgi:hypothetical protein